MKSFIKMVDYGYTLPSPLDLEKEEKLGFKVISVVTHRDRCVAYFRAVKETVK